MDKHGTILVNICQYAMMFLFPFVIAIAMLDCQGRCICIYIYRLYAYVTCPCIYIYINYIYIYNILYLLSPIKYSKKMQKVTTSSKAKLE